MNINNFTPQIYSFEEIFKKQEELKYLYEPEAKEIYSNFDIDTYDDQEYFKKVCWRITEELTEALQALEEEHDLDHYKEELIDGFNFMIELYLMYGWGPDKLLCKEEKKLSVGNPFLKIIYQLGITANCLKNRQWRRSQYLVDLIVFESRFKNVWNHYISLFRSLGMDDKDISKLWSLKYQVNLFRINSKY